MQAKLEAANKRVAKLSQSNQNVNNKTFVGQNPLAPLCPWERHFTAYSPAWWSWQAVLNYSHIFIKLQADSNILASPEASPETSPQYFMC